MPVINTHQNIAAFLDMLAVSEGDGEPSADEKPGL